MKCAICHKDIEKPHALDMCEDCFAILHRFTFDADKFHEAQNRPEALKALERMEVCDGSV